MTAQVLIVEDEILVAADIEATLEDLGYQSVGIAPDKETALLLADNEPDVAFVDLNLRDGATGAEIGKTLGARGVAVVFVTANPRMLGDGVPGTLGVLSKPCNEDCIQSALAYAINRKQGKSISPPSALMAFS